jgi:hypothetical protein
LGCLILSSAAHLSTFVGINPQALFPQIWVLHLAIFIFFIPLASTSKKLGGPSGGRLQFKENMKYAPSWAGKWIPFLFLYVFFNFFFTGLVLQKSGVPDIIDGRKVLHNHGKVIKVLSDEDYYKHQAYSVRLFSGHWLLFYYLITVMFYSHMNHPRLKEFSTSNISQE